MANVPFTGNYTRLPSERGFQFKFFCEKRQNGYMSSFQPNRLGIVAAAANAASLLGGIFGRAAQTADQLRSLAAGPQHDAALDAAVKEISPLFKQCTRCGQWVCAPVCWNKKAGLCENCAPDLEEEIASTQAMAAREQVIEKARQVDFVGQRGLKKVAGVTSPACGGNIRRFTMKQYMTDAGTTLVEVLVAIFVMGVGLLALLTLFPLGALEMAQSIQDDRTGGIAADAATFSATGQDVLRETEIFIEVTLKRGSVDPDDAAILRQEYEDLARQAADLASRLEELRWAYPREQIQPHVGPLLGQIRAIKARIGAVIQLLTIVE